MLTRKIFIIACEASGDNIAAKLINALKSRQDCQLSFSGVGGLKMIAQGFESIFPIQDLSIMGFAEIVPKIPLVFKRMNETIEAIKNFEPDIIITVDSYGFNSRLIRKIRKQNFFNGKIFHYVSPTVWAYKEKRAQVIKELYDEILVLLPFEKPCYDKINFPATFVGHPIVEDYEKPLDKLELKEKLDFAQNPILCCIMPGSRLAELEKHVSVFTQVMDNLKAKYGDNIKFFIPTLPHLKEKVFNSFAKQNAAIVVNAEDKKVLLNACDIALIKSGTSSVEMMLYNIPHVVGYKLSWLSYWFIKTQVKVKYASLINIIKGRQVIPEFIQGDFNSDQITAALLNLIESEYARKAQILNFNEILNSFGLNDSSTPSQKAADRILS